MATGRGADKAKEWLAKLQNQDIMTVGDLRDLEDDDWTGMGLTVFACRALRNALSGRSRPVNPSNNAPKASIGGETTIPDVLSTTNNADTSAPASENASKVESIPTEERPQGAEKSRIAGTDEKLES